MADPCGIIGVLAVVGQIISLTVQFGLDWKDAPTEARSFVAELQVLQTVIFDTNRNIEYYRDFADAFYGRQSSLVSQPDAAAQNTQLMVLACQASLETLLEDLEKRTQGHRIGWGRLKGAFTSKNTRETVENLQRQCQTLNSLMVNNTFAISVDTNKVAREARKEQQDWHESKESKAILDWLTPIDYYTHQNDFIKRREAGTGQWLLDSKQFEAWIESEGQTLFCTGIPGAGKTILTSIVIDTLSETWDDTVGIAYVYCNFRRQNDQNAIDLLASLLKQLARSRPSLPDAVRSLYDRHGSKQSRPSLDEISRALQSVAALYSRVFIVVDALDECQTASRRHFLPAIFELQDKCEANIFATSRSIPEIVDKFKGHLTLEIRASGDDIKRYLDGNMSSLSAFDDWGPQVRDEIKNGISDAVDGMFLLAQIYLNSLEGKTRPSAVRKALEQLRKQKPQSSEEERREVLEEAYEDTMKRIDEQNPGFRKLAFKVMSWITYAKRPMTIPELRIAVSVEPGDSKLDDDDMEQVDRMVSVCAGLVTVDAESEIIRLVHYTTQEYFERTREQWFRTAEADITTICVTYLSFDDFASGICETDEKFQERVRAHQLYDYAALNWGYHAREVSGTCQGVQEFLESGMKVEAAAQALTMTIEKTWRTYKRVPLQVKGLHLVAHFGVEGPTRALLGYQDPNIRDWRGWTPLFWAARNGQETIVKLLIDADKVEIDTRDEEGRSTLSWASEYGQAAIVKLLLDTGKVEVDSKAARDGYTPLSLAVRQQHGVVVEMLLDTGKAIPDFKSERVRGALSYGVYYAHVALLLNAGKAELNTIGDQGMTLLSYAADRPDEILAKLILAADGVEVNLADGRGLTPLTCAAEWGNEDIVRLLLEADGIDINLKDDRGLTPLSCAALYGHADIIKVLLDADGIDINLRNVKGQTPLSCAAVPKRPWLRFDAVEIDINRGEFGGQTPLSCAAKNGWVDAVRLLLNADGIDVNLEDDEGQTALSHAARKGHKDIVKVLMETGKIEPQHEIELLLREGEGEVEVENGSKDEE